MERSKKTKLSRKQIIFLALNPPVWVWLFAKYVLYLGLGKGILLPIIIEAGRSLLLPVSFIVWDVENKRKPEYVGFALKHEAVVNGVVEWFSNPEEWSDAVVLLMLAAGIIGFFTITLLIGNILIWVYNQ